MCSHRALHGGPTDWCVSQAGLTEVVDRVLRASGYFAAREVEQKQKQELEVEEAAKSAKIIKKAGASHGGYRTSTSPFLHDSCYC